MEYKHWCGNCQIRVYVERHYGKRISWEDCPYTCEYAVAMRCSTQNGRGYAAPTIIEAERNSLYDSLTRGLNEAIEHEKGNIKLQEQTIEAEENVDG